MIGDRDFVDAAAHLGDLHGHFGLEAEASGLDLDLFDHVGLEDFVADLHVGEVEVREHVGEKSEGLIAHVMPEEENSV